MSEQSSGALKTVKWTIAFDAETNQILRHLFPTGRGVSTFLSHRVKEYVWRKKYLPEYQEIASKEEWHVETNLYAVE